MEKEDIKNHAKKINHDWFSCIQAIQRNNPIFKETCYLIDPQFINIFDIKDEKQKKKARKQRKRQRD